MNGYLCKRCGYEPTNEELQRGTCPECMEATLEDEPTEPTRCPNTGELFGE